MPFFKNCMGNGKKRAAKMRAKLLRKELDGNSGLSLRLLLVDKQVDAQGVIPKATLRVRRPCAPTGTSGWSGAVAAGRASSRLRVRLRVRLRRGIPAIVQNKKQKLITNRCNNV